MRALGLGAVAGVFLGFIGPFGTYAAMPLLPRLAYWLAMILAGTLFVPVLYLLARARLSDRVPAIALVPLVAALGSVPVTLMVIAITLVMLGDRIAFTPELYLLVLVITLPLVAVQHGLWVLRTSRRTPAPAIAPQPAAPPPSPPPRPRLLDRLPGRLGDDLHCLQMEDHYVRVHMSAGSEMILMRLRDAIAELDGLDGLQVHRSWWVARTAVASWRRDGKAVTLTLANGLDVPVARDRLPEVRAAGWLDRRGLP